MFGRKKNLAKTLDKAGAALGDVTDGASKSIRSKKPNRLDQLTAGALLLGVANWISVSVFNFDIVQAVAKKKSVPGRATYGFLGVSALWAALRGARR